jgi:hypothetical protein
VGEDGHNVDYEGCGAVTLRLLEEPQEPDFPWRRKMFRRVTQYSVKIVLV